MSRSSREGHRSVEGHDSTTPRQQPISIRRPSLSLDERKETEMDTTVVAQTDAGMTRAEQQEREEKGSAGLLTLDDVLDKSSVLKVTDIIQKASITEVNQERRTQQLVNQYNKNREPQVIVEANIFRQGTRLEPGQLYLAHLNRVPELVSPNGQRLTTRITGLWTSSGTIGIVKQNEIVFGAYGSWVVNIKPGFYGKAKSGNIAILLDAGTHVIHDALFEFNKELISQLEPYIAHGNIHIIRVPIGSIAKVIENGKPRLLAYSPEPYVFNTPFFSFNPAEDLIDQTTAHISHGNIHILRVPMGSIAKVWEGNVPRLLESNNEPYVYHSAQFKLETTKGGNNAVHLFDSATKNLILHGSLKRIIPPINHVAITNNNGSLEIIRRPTVIADPRHALIDFLDMGKKTLVFPSQEVQDERKRENPNAKPNEIIYDCYRTGDGLPIGVKLVVVYQIVDPEKALIFGKDGIVPHIENVATTDMGQVIQGSSSQSYLSANQTNLAKEVKNELSLSPGASSSSSSSSAPSGFDALRDTITKKLAADLLEDGIELVRLNFEKTEVLDETISNEMSKQAVATTTANTKKAIMQQEFDVAQKKAQQEAEVLRISQEQLNTNIKSAAIAKKEAAISEAAAILTKANAEKDAADLLGKQYEMYPSLLNLRFAALQSAALANPNLRLNVTSSDLTRILSNANASFFSRQSGGGSMPLLMDDKQHQAQQEKQVGEAAQLGN